MADTTQENETQAAPRLDLGQIFAAWEFPEFERHERKRWWYIVSLAIAGALLYYAYIEQNPLFAVIIILAGITFVISEWRGPGYHSIVIAQDGVLTGSVLYRFDEFKSFFIIYEPPRIKMLYLEPKSMFRSTLGVPITDQNPTDLRRILSRYLTEDLKREQEPASDFFGKLFKF